MNSKIYRQTDSRWSSLPYPTKQRTFGGNGCGCCACTHVIIELEKYKKYTPANIRPYFVNNGYVNSNGDTLWSGIEATLKHYGFTVKSHATMDDLWDTLEKRKHKLGVIVFRGGTRGGVTWTTLGHFVAFTNYKKSNGKHYLYTKDSGDRNNDGWHCYETTMKGLIPQIWSATASDDKFIQTSTTTTSSSNKTKTAYIGKLPSLKIKKTNKEVINDTVAWAKRIAKDNRFHYGYTNKSKTINAHHNGCYFCGTNTTTGGRSKKGIVGYKRTYCCNPFVHAAWAHGGCVPKALSICRSGSSWDYHKGRGYDTSKLFDYVGHPKKSKLKKGDVLCRDTHVALYIGNGKIVEAGCGDDNKRNSKKWNKSIRIKKLTNKNYKNFPRVYRYNSSVNTTTPIRHGELSDRVVQWKAFLTWYSDGKFTSTSRYFGDTAKKWTKKFQKANGLNTSGVVNKKTLEAAKKYKK